MAQAPSPAKQVANPRIAKLIELETRGVIKPEHQAELNTYRAQGLAPAKPNLTQSQGQSTGFYGRALSANSLFNETEASTEPRGVIAQDLADAFPRVANTLTSDDRQKAEQAKQDFIAASLRYESGAAIGKDEFTRQDRIFFPQPGDGPEVIKQKAKAREVAIAGLKESAGPGAQAADQAVNAPSQQAATSPARPQAATNWRVAGAENGGGDIGFADKAHMEANSLPQGAEDFQRDLSYAIARGDLKTPEDIIAFGKNSKLNEGRGFVIDPKQAQAVLDSVSKGGGFNVNTPQWQAPDISADRGKGGVVEDVKAFARGIPAVVGADDELNAIADTFQGGTLRDNLARERAIRDYDEQNNFWPRLGGTLASAFAFPSGAAGAGRTAGIEALRSGQGMVAARTAAREAFARRMGLEAGGLAATYGFGASDGDIGDRALGAVEGGVTGLIAGYGLGKAGGLAQRYIGRTPPGGGVPPTGNAVADAAARQDIPVVAADVAPGARGATALLESLPGSGGVIRNRMQAGTDAIEQRVADIAGPAAPDRPGVGEAVQRGALEWDNRSKDVGGRLFNNIPIAPRSRAVVDNTRQALREMTEGFESNPELSKLWVENPRLKATLDALTSKDVLVEQSIVGGGKAQPLSAIQGGELSWGDLKRLRSIVGEIAGRPSFGSDGSQVAAMKKLYGALSEDMRATAAANGPKAVKAFQRANDFWRLREARVSDVLSKVVGNDPTRPLSGEQVMAQIERWSAPGSGDSGRLSNLFSSLRPEERQQVAANIAGSLGRPAPDADFSAQRFFTQVNKLSPRARVAIFGRDGADALTDLATIAEGRAGAISRLNNSGSGRVSNWLQVMRGLMGIGGGAGIGVATGIGGAAGAGLTAAGLAGANVSARLLTNPEFTRWAAQGLKATSEQAVQASIRRLTNIASRNPAIKAEVLGLQSKLMEAVNDNMPGVSRAAASDGEGPDHK